MAVDGGDVAVVDGLLTVGEGTEEDVDDITLASQNQNGQEKSH